MGVLIVTSCGKAGILYGFESAVFVNLGRSVGVGAFVGEGKVGS